MQKKADEIQVEVVADKEEDMSPYLSKCVKSKFLNDLNLIIAISVPREVHAGEKRVAITPAVAKRLIK